MVQVLDGAGKGFIAQVDSEKRLRTFSIEEPEDRHLNHKGKVWSLYFTTTPVGAGDYFFYLKNTGAATLHITDVRIMCAAADTFTYEEVTGTPVHSSATDVTPGNRNMGSSLVPAATIKKDVDTTGLTTTSVLFFERAAAANTRYKLHTTSNIVIPQGSAFAMAAGTGTALVTCVVSLVEVEVTI